MEQTTIAHVFCIRPSIYPIWCFKQNIDRVEGRRRWRGWIQWIHILETEICNKFYLKIIIPIPLYYFPAIGFPPIIGFLGQIRTQLNRFWERLRERERDKWKREKEPERVRHGEEEERKRYWKFIQDRDNHRNTERNELRKNEGNIKIWQK